MKFNILDRIVPKGIFKNIIMNQACKIYFCRKLDLEIFENYFVHNKNLKFFEPKNPIYNKTQEKFAIVKNLNKT